MLDGIQLYLMDRDVAVPFQMEIAATGRHTGAGAILECREVLRLLPERRMLCRAIFQKQTVIAKLFLHPDKSEHDYEQELAGHEYLIRAKIITPRLLTSGSLNNAGFYVLYEYIDSVTSLESHIALKPNKSSMAHIKILLPIIAQMHNVNIQQIDLHLNNFLVLEKDNNTSIFTIDCGDVSALNSSSDKRRAQIHKNLADILSQLPIIYDQFLHDFLLLYQQKSTLKQALSHDLLCQEINQWRTWRIRKYVKKSARSCSEFIREQNWSEMRVYKREYAGKEWLKFYQRLDELVKNSPRLKDGNTATVALAECEGKKIVIKRYNIKSFTHWLERFWRPSRAWKTWENAHRLTVLGIKTPKPIAIIEQRFGWLRSKAFYLSEYDSAEDALAKYSREKEVSEAHLEAFKQLLTALLFSRLSHGDLKANNILLTENGLSLIDLDAMQLYKNPRRFSQAFTKDLHRFMRNWPLESKVYQQFEQLLEKLPDNSIC